ncbi:hypothetical protein M947_02370 [Sulfurimonas hongkongensis]|uniref:Uncharacterized protein n=1 Tax=Sulfurimonas hongkongensis TaxID=1172190 RepID=T0L324_9BACT|nr:hypothetical protein [Sulfurimonas hongkongensis]EQB40198.1 hypothetical protein M947_02370 [Sulfurimonas hongkongensis]
MSKMSIADAATKLGVSKEAIHNRIRRGSLESVVEDGVKLVLLDSDVTNKQTIKQTNKRATQQNDDKYYKLLEDQNERLRQKVDRLEGETKSLREQKEQMLIEERIRIEKIYKDKDEQLKNMLNAISSKFLQHTLKEELIIDSQDLVEAEIEVDEEKSTLISLKKYFKQSSYSAKKLKKLKEKFKKAAKEDDERFQKIGKKHYLDTSKYDYSDLFS